MLTWKLKGRILKETAAFKVILPVKRKTWGQFHYSEWFVHWIHIWTWPSSVRAPKPLPQDLCILALHRQKQTERRRRCHVATYLYHMFRLEKKNWANVLLIIASPREQALPERSIFDSARRAADAASKVPRAYWGTAALKSCLMTLPALCSLLFGRISRKTNCSAINIKKN